MDLVQIWQHMRQSLAPNEHFGKKKAKTSGRPETGFLRVLFSHIFLKSLKYF